MTSCEQISHDERRQVTGCQLSSLASLLNRLLCKNDSLIFDPRRFYNVTQACCCPTEAGVVSQQACQSTRWRGMAIANTETASTRHSCTLRPRTYVNLYQQIRSSEDYSVCRFLGPNTPSNLDNARLICPSKRFEKALVSSLLSNRKLIHIFYLQKVSSTRGDPFVPTLYQPGDLHIVCSADISARM